MRFELFEGETLSGVFTTRRMAIADAELIAAKRGQRLRWIRRFKGVITGVPDAMAGGATFTVQSVAEDSYSRVKSHYMRR